MISKSLVAASRVGMLSLVLVALGLLSGSSEADAQQSPPALVRIGHIRLAAPQHIAISLLERPAEDNGLAGARLAIDDNNTTGKFTNQKF